MIAPDALGRSVDIFLAAQPAVPRRHPAGTVADRADEAQILFLDRQRVGVEQQRRRATGQCRIADTVECLRRRRRTRREGAGGEMFRSEEHTSELQSLMRISYAVFCLKKKKKTY